jgi:hypothetical protein
LSPRCGFYGRTALIGLIHGQAYNTCAWALASLLDNTRIVVRRYQMLQWHYSIMDTVTRWSPLLALLALLVVDLPLASGLIQLPGFENVEVMLRWDTVVLIITVGVNVVGLLQARRQKYVTDRYVAVIVFCALLAVFGLLAVLSGG